MTISLIRLLALTVCLLLPASAQSPKPPEDPGPAVGSQIPAFTAEDQNGRARTFDSLKGPNGLLLLFVRSADW